MFRFLEPPTERGRILNYILLVLMLITFLQGFFLCMSHEAKGATYFVSAIIYLFSVTQLSYFSCLLNEVFMVAVIWILLLEMANKLQNGLYNMYLSGQGIYKMSSLVFSIVSAYFNLAAYKTYKQIALQIHLYELNEEQEHSAQQ